MRPIISLTTLFLILFTSCDKDPYEDLTTSFQGIAYSGPNEPLENGYFDIVGYGNLFSNPGQVFERTIQTDSDGRFNVRITTNDVSSFSFGTTGNFEAARLTCAGPTTTAVCTLMDAGKSHEDIIIYTYVN